MGIFVFSSLSQNTVDTAPLCPIKVISIIYVPVIEYFFMSLASFELASAKVASNKESTVTANSSSVAPSLDFPTR